ncbi:Colicin-Ia [Providencia rettgeri]|nr:Colicin-Ia [Providencia rettgeri]
MAEQAKGKKIRNVEDALKAYNKYSNNISRKIDAKDRKAITAALESVKTEDIAKISRNLVRVCYTQAEQLTLLIGQMN